MIHGVSTRPGMRETITHVECLELDAWVDELELRKLYRDINDKLPAVNFLSYHIKTGQPDDDGKIALQNLDWCGEWSGSSYSTLLKRVLPIVMGRASVVCFWDGGKERTGYRVKNGVVVRCSADLVLEPAERNQNAPADVEPTGATKESASH